jgi:hypothetical protein
MIWFLILDRIELSPLVRLAAAWKRHGSSSTSDEYLSTAARVQARMQLRPDEPAGAVL